MTLHDITSTLSLPPLNVQADIHDVVQSSANAHASSVFVCIRGNLHDGHDHATEAYAKGCRLFVAEHPITLPRDAVVLYVPDTRSALARLACLHYDNPSRQMRIIGITGTKGKTTVANLICHILNRADVPCGYIGTNGVAYRNVSRPLKNTTPDPLTLQAILREMLDAGVQTAVLEVSSQGIYQSRIEGIEFDTCIYTNLYSDHVGPGEHPDFAHYRNCKHRLFTDFACKAMIYCADDAHSDFMKSGTSASMQISCSVQNSNADYAADTIKPILTDMQAMTEFTVLCKGERVHATLPLLGTFNVSNALLALAATVDGFHIPLSRATALLSDATVTGRTELIRMPNGAFAVIDYAHNGASLAHLLTSLRTYQPNRMICLFGSVGERSQLRRKELGEVAAKLCDLVILTSDNPGKEDPEAIIEEIASAFRGTDTPYLCVVDRKEAIKKATALCQKGDVLVLAGKGHENYQLIGDKRLPYSDREALQACLESARMEELIN